MTGRERFNRQLHYQPVDRCFNMEFGYWEENYKLWPMFVENGITTEWQANEYFNFDRIEMRGGNIWLNPSFAGQVIEERETTTVIMNEDGVLAEVAKTGGASIPHYIKPSVVTPDDWQRVKDERLRRDDPARKVDIEKLKTETPPDRDFPVGVWVGSMIGKIRDMLTFEGLAYAMYDYPEMVEDMVETSCALVEDYLDQALPHAQFDYAAGWEDICFNNGPIVSVDFFQNVVAPRYKRISRKLQAAGIDIWYIDCDGDVRPILPAMMDAGINCLFPYEVNGCAHPSQLFATYGRELRIMGGVDKMQLGKGRDAIKACLESLAPLVERGGYIPFCDHRCPPNVNPDDYLYYLDLKEEMFGRIRA
jgi:uroporphyrinogen decarboxylase